VGARSKSRKRAVDLLFEADARGIDAVTLLADRVGSPDVPPINDYTVTLVEGVTARREEIDRLIADHAEGWSLQRMPAVDRAVLRLGVYELLWADDVPDAVAIDEAVELAKSLSTDDSPRFVNGVLAQLRRDAPLDHSAVDHSVIDHSAHPQTGS
jgi:transcription antitermination protein NusB